MILYLGSSAAAKLLVEEAESAVLAAHLDAAVVAGDQVVSCVLLETGCVGSRCGSASPRLR